MLTFNFKPFSKCVLLVVILLSLRIDIFAAAGDLDPTFGIGGKVTLDRIGPNHDFANDSSIQPDGKIVFAGSTLRRNGYPQAVLIRLLPNGNLDSSFGNGGKIQPDLGGISANFYSVLALADGKILAAGTIFTGTGNDFLIVRVNGDGTLDSSFGTNGVVTTDFDDDDYLYDIVIQPDGKIVTAGSSGEFSYDGGYDYEWVILRYYPDGALDTQFASGGIAEGFECGDDDSASSVAIQSDGKIVVGGGIHCPSGYETNLGILRLNSDGTPDRFFGTDGKVITDINEDEFGGAVAIQSDGKILIGGTTFANGARRKIVLVRYNSNGNIDRTFGNSGKVILKAGKTSRFSSFALQSDGKIVVAGEAGRNSVKTDFVVLRCDVNGSLDTSFGSGGIVRTDFSKSRDEVRSVALDSNGIVVAGITVTAKQFDIAVVRYDTQGYLDSNFGSSGKLTVNFNSSLLEYVNSVKVQQDGKILAAGSEVGYPIRRPLITRYLPDGTLDPGFGNEGISSDWVGEFDHIGDIALSSNGKIVVVGTAGGEEQHHSLFVARYDSSGFLDPEFGSHGITSIQLDGYYQGLSKVSIQPDGKIVSSGFVITDDGDPFLTIRFNEDGTLDNTFGDQGIVMTRIFSQENQVSTALTIQTDGKIVVVGYLNDYGGGSGLQIAMVRYNTDGTLDSTFGSGGIVLTNVSPGDDSASGIVLQQDGKILVGGEVDDDSQDDRDFVLLRYLNDGSLDAAFGSGGIERTDFSGIDILESLAIQPDGKIIAAGQTGNETSVEFALARYNVDGSLDSLFGIDGKVITPFGSYGYAYDVVLQLDGKIVTAGTADMGVTLYDFAIARYQSQ